MTRADLLAQLLAEQRGDPDQLEAETTDGPAAIRHRRRVLLNALAVRNGRGRRPRTRLHRPRLILRHLETAERPWESRDGWAAEMCDGWAE